jgi:hypothetical protein
MNLATVLTLWLAGSEKHWSEAFLRKKGLYAVAGVAQFFWHRAGKIGFAMIERSGLLLFQFYFVRRKSCSPAPLMPCWPVNAGYRKRRCGHGVRGIAARPNMSSKEFA